MHCCDSICGSSACGFIRGIYTAICYTENSLLSSVVRCLNSSGIALCSSILLFALQEMVCSVL